VKRLAFGVIGLSLISGFSAAQNIKVIGPVPPSDTGQLYDIQVGAFRIAANAAQAAEKLQIAGFDPVYEKHNGLVRVIVTGLGYSELRPSFERLRCAGFREVVVRKCAARPAVVVSVPAPVPAPDMDAPLVPAPDMNTPPDAAAVAAAADDILDAAVSAAADDVLDAAVPAAGTDSAVDSGGAVEGDVDADKQDVDFNAGREDLVIIWEKEKSEPPPHLFKELYGGP
jgi:hypothetical protein